MTRFLFTTFLRLSPNENQICSFIATIKRASFKTLSWLKRLQVSQGNLLHLKRKTTKEFISNKLLHNYVRTIVVGKMLDWNTFFSLHSVQK